MNTSDDRYKAMKFEEPTRIPLSCGILPAAWMKYREELRELTAGFPEIFGRESTDRDYDEVGGNYVEGDHVDAWGCRWENIHHGMAAIVTGHPVPTRKDVHSLRMPAEDDGMPHGFMYLRLQDLRGFEEIMVDFAEEPPELQMLIDIVIEYNLRGAALKLEQATEAEQLFSFGDDLGLQTSLPVSPEKWRQYLKPCFARIYRPFKEAGHYVYMHTDGHINEIIPDLMDCGVDVVNPQVRANGLESLRQVCPGKICVYLDLERQLFHFATPAQIDEHVHEAVEFLGSPEGGLWLKAEVDQGIPLVNIRAIFEAMVRHSSHFSGETA